MGAGGASDGMVAVPCTLYGMEALEAGVTHHRLPNVEGVGCGMWDVGCGVRGEGCGVWDVGCGVWREG